MKAPTHTEDGWPFAKTLAEVLDGSETLAEWRLGACHEALDALAAGQVCVPDGMPSNGLYTGAGMYLGSQTFHRSLFSNMIPHCQGDALAGLTAALWALA